MQMGDGAEANKEFMEQLRLQELYGRTNEDGSNPFTYTDPEDGTVYDWDQEKKAWFPKVGPPLYFPAFIFFSVFISRLSVDFHIQTVAEDITYWTVDSKHFRHCYEAGFFNFSR